MLTLHGDRLHSTLTQFCAHSRLFSMKNAMTLVELRAAALMLVCLVLGLIAPGESALPYAYQMDSGMQVIVFDGSVTGTVWYPPQCCGDVVSAQSNFCNGKGASNGPFGNSRLFVGLNP